MKLEKAILRLENTFTNEEIIIDRETDQAVKLLIEAGKALPQYRNKLKHPELWLLPGETEQ